ncbi:MAG: MFS transporter [Planctomycetota bacterium]
MPNSEEPRPGLLERFGLGRPELRAWAMYDWANSAFMTTVITVFFPIFFFDVYAAGVSNEVATGRFAFATTIALAISAVLSPWLGALADFRAIKKRMLGICLSLGVVSTAGLFFCRLGDWIPALVLFALGNIGASASLVFYDALLPHIASEKEMDRVSTAGYALGYLGGGVLLVVNVAWFLKPGWFGIPDQETAVRLSFLSVAVWWFVFTIPLFRRVSEPPRALEPDERVGMSPMRVACTRLLETIKALRSFRQALLFMVAFMIYNDGIGTIFRMAAIYGKELKLSNQNLVMAILLVQFVGIPFAFAFGWLAGKIGTKPAIFIGLVCYVGISVFGAFVTTATHFYLLAFAVAMVQGGTQALSRSLFASMIPRHKSAECFAFFSVFEKFTGILGPAVFGGMTILTGSSHWAILCVAIFFLVGGILLAFVRVEEGQRAAREADAAALPLPDAVRMEAR